jgi:uncharacterized protein (TIGR00251 family)
MEIVKFIAKSRKILEKEGILYLSLKIIPNAQKTMFSEILNGEDQILKIRVAAVPEKGKANKEIEKFIKKEFSAKKVEIMTGGTSALKTIKLSN